MMVCMMGGLVFCSAANAVTSDSSGNPYQSIIDRNVFSLKPPPPPPDPTEVNKPQVLKITLTGITTILGNKRVLMKTAPPAGKPGEAPKSEQSYILTEGQRDGDIEVLEIDDKAWSVKVNNAGSVQTLTFEKDGAKLPSTPAPAAPPANGAPQIPGLPGARLLPQPPGAAGAPTFQLPTRIPRLPTPGSQASDAGLGSAGSSPSYGAPGFLPGNTSTSAFQSSSAGSSQAATPTTQYSLEEQAIMIEANRQRGGPGAALLPPTILTPKLNEGTTTPAQNSGSQNPMLPPVPGRPMTPGPY